MRFYITLNEEKEKDKLIIDLLEKQYSAKDYVTALLYQNATNCTELHLLAPNRIESDINNIVTTVPNAPNCTEMEQKGNIELNDELRGFFE